MTASPSSTVGDLKLPSQLSQDIKKSVIRTPKAYAKSANGIPKPTTTFAVIGEKGAGKSTFINALISSLHGGPFELLRTGIGAEAQVGTTECTLLPLHRIWWPELKDEDLPAYFNMWDTIGLATNDNITPQNVASLMTPLVSGELPNFARSLSTTMDRGLHPTPAAQAIIYCLIASARDEDFNRVKVIHQFLQIPTSRNPLGIPLYLVATKAENFVTNMINDKTGEDNFCDIPTSPNVHKTLRHFSEKSGVPFQRCTVSFGVSSLCCSQTPNPSDPRESLMLTLISNISREVGTRNAFSLADELKGAGIQGVHGGGKTPLYADRAGIVLVLNVTDATKSASKVAEAQGLDGPALFSLSEAEVNAVFAECSVGVRKAVWRLVMSYSTTSTAPSPTCFSQMASVRAPSKAAKQHFRICKTSQHPANTTAKWIWDKVLNTSDSVSGTQGSHEIRILASGTYLLCFRASFLTVSGNNFFIQLYLNDVVHSESYFSDANGHNQSYNMMDVITTSDIARIHYQVQGNHNHINKENFNVLNIVQQ